MAAGAKGACLRGMPPSALPPPCYVASMASNGEPIGPGATLIDTDSARRPARDAGRPRRLEQAPTSFPGSPMA